MCRCFLIIASICLTTGCASNRYKPATAEVETPATQLAQASFDDAVPASALLFDPPVIANQPMPELSRDQRDVSAFVGFDQSVTTLYFTNLNDWQRIDGSGSQRRASSVTFGVRTR